MTKAAWRAWTRFWFESNQPGRMRAFRKVFGALLVVIYSIRTLDLELFFSESGIMPLAAVSQVLPMDFRHSLLFVFTGKTALWILHAAFLASLVSLTAGWRPRLSAAAAFVLHVSFLHRNMSPTYGVDLITTFYLLYLSFAAYSEKAGQVASILGSVSFRLLQIQLCVIYAFSGLDKVRGAPWWAGEALWGVVANPQLARWDFSLFAHLPLALVAGTYATLAWEIYMPVLVWVRPVRNLMLAFGVALHVAIGVMINIPFFSALMIVSYILFADDKWIPKSLSRSG